LIPFSTHGPAAAGPRVCAHPKASEVKQKAVLALADGSVFHGDSIGAEGAAVGEVVFNTAMTGYQEILTDPSYARQIVTLTYPHIGNTGCNDVDAESSRVHAAGLVIRDLPLLSSSWREQESLPEYLRTRGVVAIAGIDTRRLTRILRDRGAQNGALVAGAAADDIDGALAQARGFPGLKGMDLARVVSVRQPYEWNEGTHDLDARAFRASAARFHVVVYDFGVKTNILRMLADRGCRLTVVPAETPASEVLALQPDGVMLSNGPGDPEPCGYAIAAIRAFIAARLPTFGICLGHQLLGLAAGARTIKMKFGHHGANHPVQDLATGRVMISSQNHGFAVDETSLPANVRATHRSLFDGSLQGIELTDAPAFGFQGHPEASPGPHDVATLFDRFVAMLLPGSGAGESGPVVPRTNRPGVRAS
jgi:carbamoyl-phosphate synthase small subunit